MLHIVDDKLWALGPKKALAPIFQHAVAKKEEAPQKSAKGEEVKVDETKADKKQEKGKEKEKEKKKESESEEEEEEESEEEEEQEQGNDDFVQFFGGMIKKKPAPGAGTPAPKKATPATKTTTVSKPVATKKQDDFDDDDDGKKKKGGKKETKGKGKKKEEEDEPKKQQKGKKGKKAKESEDEDEDEEDEEEEEEEKKVDTGKGGAKGGAAIPAKIMEEYVMEAFLTALKISLDDKDLPIDGQEFFSKHMNPCRREGVNLDLKNTSYQKMGKFLQAMTKSSIIEFKESKKGANPQIIKVNRHHPK